jgi:hypothetical protein
VRDRTNTRIFVISLLILLICLTRVSGVWAQAQTLNISGLQYPAQAVLQNGVAQITVTFTVSYSDIIVSNNGGLVFGVNLANPDGSAGPWASGSGTSTPDACELGSNGNGPTNPCTVGPPLSFGSESASFTVALSSTQSLLACGEPLDESGNLIDSALICQSFTVSVSNGQAQSQGTVSAVQPSILSLLTQPYVYGGITVVVIVAVLTVILLRKRNASPPPQY